MKASDYDALPEFDWDKHRSRPGTYKTRVHIKPYWNIHPWDHRQEVTLIRVSIGFDKHFTISSFNERLE